MVHPLINYFIKVIFFLSNELICKKNNNNNNNKSIININENCIYKRILFIK